MVEEERTTREEGSKFLQITHAYLRTDIPSVKREVIARAIEQLTEVIGILKDGAASEGDIAIAMDLLALADRQLLEIKTLNSLNNNEVNDAFNS